MSEDNLDPNAQGGDNQDPNAGGTGTIERTWRDDVDPQYKDHPSLANFKTPADLAKSWVNAQSIIGKEKLPVPGKDADPLAEGGNEEYNMVYDRLGRPSDPSAYEIPEVESPEGMPAVPEETIKGFKELSHKIGLLPHQVKELYKWQHEQAAGTLKANTQQTQQAFQTAEATMRKEYGKAYDANLGGAKALVLKFGGKEALESLDRTGVGNDPHFIKMIVKIAKQFGEDGNINLGDTQAGVMTPEEAQSEINKIKADKQGAYWNPPDDSGRKKFTDNEHRAMVKKVNDLYQMAFPT